VLLAFVLVAVTAYFVTAPLRDRRPSVAEADRGTENPRLANLEARKEAKYREIRDAELDYRTGKLSEEDHRMLDRALRREAIAILEEIDGAMEGGDGGSDRGGSDAGRGTR